MPSIGESGESTFYWMSRVQLTCPSGCSKTLFYDVLLGGTVAWEAGCARQAGGECEAGQRVGVLGSVKDCTLMHSGGQCILSPCVFCLQNLAVTDTLYNKVVKDLCVSRNQAWTLKYGADMP